MTIVTEKYIRKPLYVDAVRVTGANFEEIAKWCQGEVLRDDVPGEGTGKKYIKVRVHNPKNPRQTKAFIGDWLLYTERGYKVYTSKAFHTAFDIVVKPDLAETPGDPLALQVGADVELVDGEEPKSITSEANRLQAEVVNGNATIESELPDPTAIEEVADELEEHYIRATPERIAEAILENEEARQDINIPKYPEATTIGGTPREEINVSKPFSQGGGGSVDLADDVREKVDPAAVEGKRVITIEEQAELNSDEVREMVQSGEAVLAQDV